VAWFLRLLDAYDPCPSNPLPEGIGYYRRRYR
jgi:hypothetical protein